MKIVRRRAKVIKIGNVYIGGDNTIAIQSMDQVETRDIEKTVKQYKINLLLTASKQSAAYFNTLNIPNFLPKTKPMNF